MTLHSEYQRLSLQRTLGLAMVAVEALAIGYLSQTVFFPLLVVVAGFVAAFSTIRLTMNRQRVYDTIGLIAILFVAKYLLTDDNPRYTRMFASQHVAISLAQFVLALQTTLFLVKRRDSRLPFAFPGMGVVALVCAAIIQVEENERYLFQAMCVTFALLAALYCDASRRFISVGPRRRFGRPGVSILILSLIAGVAWASATAMHRYERELDEIVQRYLMTDRLQQTVGFSETAVLGSLSLRKNRDSMNPALKIRSRPSPGYLRGRAYEVYEDLKWLMQASGRTIHPRETGPGELGEPAQAGSYFPIERASLLSELKTLRLESFEVWPTSAVNGTYMSPLHVEWLLAKSPVVTADRHCILRGAEISEAMPYTVFCRTGLTAEQQTEPDPETRNLMLGLPEWAETESDIKALAAKVFAGCTTIGEKIAAVKHHFHSQYQYSLTVSVPGEYGNRPLLWFLRSPGAAHCEYFASGTTILLRMAGVPSRYVAGFVVHEQNQFSHEWVARNRDAHAWCEIWDPDTGWRTVDSTPSGGIPSAGSADSLQQFREYLAHRAQQLRAEWRQHGVAMLSSWMSSLLTSPLGMATLLLTGAGLLYRQRQALWHLWKRPKYRFEPGLESVQRLCLQMDRAAGRRFRQRGAGETLTQFAAALVAASREDDPALKAVAEWYYQYSNLRYLPFQDAAELTALIQAAGPLVKQLGARHA